jgi:hypothetical protein
LELIIRMKTVTRFLIFLAAILIWLIVLVLLNNLYLNQGDLVIVGLAAGLAVVTTVAAARILRT